MKPLFLSPIALVLIGAGLTASIPGCDVGNEGDRCNPNLSHDECSSGLACQQPVDCPESYCCPAVGNSSNPFCQPGCAGGQASVCAAGGDADCPSEGGDDGGGDGGADSATEATSSSEGGSG
jgi:hypothetical protein